MMRAGVACLSAERTRCVLPSDGFPPFFPSHVANDDAALSCAWLLVVVLLLLVLLLTLSSFASWSNDGAPLKNQFVLLAD